MGLEAYGLSKPFFALAPMANITTYPFASQAVKYGADIVWTPMVHTDTILNNWEEAEKVLNFKDIPKYIVQIVGSEPEKFAKSVQLIEKNLKPVGIDLNFACPDKNIVKSGCGGALLKDPEKMFEIIKAVKKVTELPVSVKTRSGWDYPTQISELIGKFSDLGVDIITVHPRLVTQGFRGEADWGVISELKKRYPQVAICGSGDIKSWHEAIAKQEETRCDGLMIGRGALGKPWMFEEIIEQKNHVFNLDEIKGLVLDLSEKAEDIWGEKGIIESRTHYANYFKGFDGAQEYRKKLMPVKSLVELKEVI
jgi:tRNA-dihydrouridine synthase B